MVAQQAKLYNKHCVHNHINVDNKEILTVNYNDLFLHACNSIKLLDARITNIENSLLLPEENPILIKQVAIEESKLNSTPQDDLILRIEELERQIILQQNQINEHQKIILLLKKYINKLK